MIPDIFIIIATVILQLVYWFFLGLDFVMPEQFTTAIEWLFQSVHTVDGIFPVSTLLSATIVLLIFFSLFYTLKIILWLISFIPGVGHKDLPKISERNNIDLTPSGHNQVNLRNRFHSKGRRSRNTRDIR